MTEQVLLSALRLGPLRHTHSHNQGGRRKELARSCRCGGDDPTHALPPDDAPSDAPPRCGDPPAAGADCDFARGCDRRASTLGYCCRQKHPKHPSSARGREVWSREEASSVRVPWATSASTRESSCSIPTATLVGAQPVSDPRPFPRPLPVPDPRLPTPVREAYRGGGGARRRCTSTLKHSEQTRPRRRTKHTRKRAKPL